MFMSTLAMDLREAWDKIPVEIQSAWNAYAPKAKIKSTDFKNWIGNTAGNCAEFMSDDAAQYALYAARKLGLNCTSYDNRLFETAALAKTEMDQIQTALNGMLTAALRMPQLPLQQLLQHDDTDAVTLNKWLKELYRINKDGNFKVLEKAFNAQRALIISMDYPDADILKLEDVHKPRAKN